MRPEEAKLYELVTAARNARRTFAEEMQGETNPQVVAMRDKATAEYQAFDAVMAAMVGMPAQLKLYAEGGK